MPVSLKIILLMLAKLRQPAPDVTGKWLAG